MTKKMLGVVAGLIVWLAVVSVAGIFLRVVWPAYGAVADTMAFTLPMLLTRLAIGAVATLAAGLTTAALASGSTAARMITGAILVAAFIPVHLNLWDTFPLWYHLTFLLSLIPLTYLGGVAARPLRSAVRH